MFGFLAFHSVCVCMCVWCVCVFYPWNPISHSYEKEAKFLLKITLKWMKLLQWIKWCFNKVSFYPWSIRQIFKVSKRNEPSQIKCSFIVLEFKILFILIWLGFGKQISFSAKIKQMKRKKVVIPDSKIEFFFLLLLLIFYIIKMRFYLSTLSGSVDKKPFTHSTAAAKTGKKRRKKRERKTLNLDRENGIFLSTFDLNALNGYQRSFFCWFQ